MKTWKIAVVALMAIAIIALSGLFTYAWWTSYHRTSLRPFVYVNFDWNGASGFRTEVINGTQYYTLSPGQIGHVNLTLTSPPWIDYTQSLGLEAEILHDMNGPPAIQYPVPQNVELTVDPSSLALFANNSAIIELTVNASTETATGTWYIEIDVSTASGSTIGLGFNFAIEP